MEVLACPHCERLFQVKPAVLGKKIRCRGCRGIFHVPHDTTNVPLGGPAAESHRDDAVPTSAIPCIIDGLDARICPNCGRTFRMKTSFAGKTIRCRGCQLPFLVAATDLAGMEPASARQSTPDTLRPHPAADVAPASSSRDSLLPTPSPPQVAPQLLSPTVFEDIGDMVADLLPGEQVTSVVRPRNVLRLSPPPSNPVVTMIALVFGGVCALPVTAWILVTFFPEKYREIVAGMPHVIRNWLP